MSYEDYIEEFWVKAVSMKMDSSQIALGLGLLHIWRNADFPPRCLVKNEELCNLLGITKNTLSAARKRLIDNGLIVYEEGNGRKQPVYIFNVASGVEKEDESDVVATSPKPVERPKPKVSRPKVVERQPSLFDEKDMSQKRKVKDFAPPQFSEVVRICTVKGMTEQEAREFYDYYNAQGWVTSSGQKIKNVDSMVNRWLTLKKKRYESDRRFVSERPTVADNIRESQEYLIREVQQSILSQADGGGREFLEGLPDYNEGI